MKRRDFLKGSFAAAALAYLGVPSMASALIDARNRSSRFTGNRKYIFHDFRHTGFPPAPETWTIEGVQHMQVIVRSSAPNYAVTWPDITTAPTEQWYDDFAGQFQSGGLGLPTDEPDSRWHSGYVYLDHETFPGQEGFGGASQAERLQAATDLATIIANLKERMPNYTFGIYAAHGTGPGNRWFDMVVPGSAAWATMRSKMLDFAAVYEVVDFCMPTLYVPYVRSADGPAAMMGYVEDFIEQNVLLERMMIRQYGNNQPVVPFIGWRKAGNDSLAYMELDMWEEVVRRTYLAADGFIMWGGTGVTWSAFEAMPYFTDVIVPRIQSGRYW